jgi:GAF domain-containing protein
LPEAFNQAMKGIEVNATGDICCQALLAGAPVGAHDFPGEVRWQRFAQLVAPYGLRAGWSIPIFGSNGQALGTFANYYWEPRDPTPRDTELVEIVTRTAAIAIERWRAAEALRESEQRFARYME